MQTWPVLSIFLSPAWRPPAAQGPPPLLHLQVPTGAFKAAWKTGEQTQVCVPLDGNLHAPLHPSQCALSTHLDTPQTHARIQMLTHSSHIHSVPRHITQKGSHTQSHTLRYTPKMTHAHICTDMHTGSHRHMLTFMDTDTSLIQPHIFMRTRVHTRTHAHREKHSQVPTQRCSHS